METRSKTPNWNWSSVYSNQLPSLAYPHGQFSPTMFEYLKYAGYDGAFSGIAGLNFKDANRC
jgi:hypothetical protein